MKILVCTDGSRHSELVVEEACSIAQAMKAVKKDVFVSVIHTYKRKYTKSTWYLSRSEETVGARELVKQMGLLDDLENIERAKVLEAAAEVFQKNDLAVNTILKEGNPAEIICDVASAEGFNLIVIGSRGRRARRGVLLGSVSNEVVQNSNINVYVVKSTSPIY